MRLHMGDGTVKPEYSLPGQLPRAKPWRMFRNGLNLDATSAAKSMEETDRLPADLMASDFPGATAYTSWWRQDSAGRWPNEASWDYSGEPVVKSMPAVSGYAVAVDWGMGPSYNAYYCKYADGSLEQLTQEEYEQLVRDVRKTHEQVHRSATDIPGIMGLC